MKVPTTPTSPEVPDTNPKDAEAEKERLRKLQIKLVLDRIKADEILYPFVGGKSK